MAVDLNKLSVGDKITIKSGAYNIAPYNEGKPNGKFASFVYNMEYTIMQVGLGSDKGTRTNYVAFGIPGQGYTGAIAVEDIKEWNGISTATPVTKPKETKPKKTKPAEKPQTKTEPQADTSELDDSAERRKDMSDAMYNTTTESFVMYNGKPYAAPQEKSFGSMNGKSNAVTLTTTTPRSILSTEQIIDTGAIQKNGQSYPADPSNIASLRQTYDRNKDKSFIYPEFTTNAKTHSVTYDYTINLEKFWSPDKGQTWDDDPLRKIEALHQIPTLGRRESFRQKVENYFRFKLPNPNNALTKGFAHVFFTRPDLNVLNYNGANAEYSIPIACENDPSIYYAFRNNLDILRELVADNGMEHDFMFLLSNAAKSFSLLDEKIKTDEWTKTWTGHTVSYGKHSNDSKSASTFEIEYTDDRNLSIYHLHKLWIDYIDKVYRGAIVPRGMELMENGMWKPAHGVSPKDNGGAFSFTADKVLDYACSVYYILTAEDGESIIFWSKYYGVFPVVAPSSPFSYTYGDVVSNPKLSIEYAYSFKQDYNPFNLAEFNWLYRKPSHDKAQYTYVSSYNKNALGAGPSRVGAPFIETIANDQLDEPYQFKLRFRPVKDKGATSSTYYKSTKGMST